MTKYRIRLRNGRVIGPFIEDQLLELRQKGHITGGEEAQIFPTGDWQSVQNFDFFKKELTVDQNQNLTENVKEETFVINLQNFKKQKNELEIDQIDIKEHSPVENLTETIRIPSPISPPPKKEEAFDLELDQQPEIQKNHDPVIIEIEDQEERFDKTQINPIAQKEIELMRRKKKEEEEKQKAAEEELKRIQEEEEQKKREAKQVAVYDESTQMLKMDHIKSDLILLAEEEEKNIAKIEKEIKKKKKKEDQEELKEEEDTQDDEQKKKKKKIIILLAAAAILYAVLFPSEDEKSKKPSFHSPIFMDCWIIVGL